MAEPDDAGNGGGKTFTQAELDAIIADRLKRQAAQLKANAPSDDELEALRTKAKQFDAIEETSKDDLQRANDQIETLKAQLADKDSEIGSLKNTTRDLTVKHAVIAEAAKAQFGEKKADTFVDPEDAYLGLDKSAVEFDDEGNPQNVAELVGKVAESKPHLLGVRAQAPSLDGGARETTTDNPDLTPEQEHARWLAERL